MYKKISFLERRRDGEEKGWRGEGVERRRGGEEKGGVCIGEGGGVERRRGGWGED
jgi:hypothetical protein